MISSPSIQPIFSLNKVLMTKQTTLSISYPHGYVEALRDINAEEDILKATQEFIRMY